MKNELFVEVPLDISAVTGEPDAKGTSDAVILRYVDNEIVVADLKYGYSPVEPGPQLKIYALAVHQRYEMLWDWKTVRLVIIQPRAGGVKEEVITVDELLAFGEKVKQAVAAIDESAHNPEDFLVTSDKGCKWCKAKATCPQIRKEIMADFEALPVEDIESLSDDGLAEMYAKTETIQGWCKAIGEEVYSRLRRGLPVRGLKLVEGKRGNRAWSKADEVETLMKSMRLSQSEMYDMKLITPTTAEKRLAKEHPRQWEKLQSFVTQKAGSPTVAPESDPRPAVSTQVGDDEFEAV